MKNYCSATVTITPPLYEQVAGAVTTTRPCRQVEWKDGLCRHHHPDSKILKEERRKKNEEYNLAYKERIAKEAKEREEKPKRIEEAIALLAQNGYVVVNANDYMAHIEKATGRSDMNYRRAMDDNFRLRAIIRMFAEVLEREVPQLQPAERNIKVTKVTP